MHSISAVIARSLSPFDPRYRDWVMESGAQTHLFTELHESIEAKLLELDTEAVAAQLSVQPDIIIARITAVNGTINATYDVQSISSPAITLTDVTPINRFFELDPMGNALVDYLAAITSASETGPDTWGKGMAKIIRYQIAGTPPPAGDGACIANAGACSVTSAVACEASGDTFVAGSLCPGYVVEITEDVKISTCINPSPVLFPPPVISQIAGLLN